MDEKNKKWLTGLENREISIKDRNILFIYKKVERIAAATYIITNVFDDKEPVKWDLRQKSLELLSFITHLKDNFISERERTLHAIEEILFATISSFSISYLSGMLSDMNYSILKKEVEFTIDLIKGTRGYVLTSDFFISSNDISPAFYNEKKIEHPNQKDSHYKGHKGHIYQKDEIQNSSIIVKQGDEGIANDPYSASFIKKNNRKNNIVEIVKMKKRVTIKDISLIIKDCSEKTIQRELVSLVKKGVLKREGERRWSTYSLS